MNSVNCNYQALSFKARPIPQNFVEKAAQKLLDTKVKEVDVYCHTSADEDAINCAKVFYNWLVSHGKKANICTPLSDVKDLYFNPSQYTLKKGNKPANRTVILDFNSKDRLNDICRKIIDKTKLKDIIILDHHATDSHTFNSNLYVDETAKSCCSILVRFFDALKEKLNMNDIKSLYCGMVSDFKKSGLLKLINDNGSYSIKKTDVILNDKNSLEVFEKLDNLLLSEDKNEILHHLDILSRLNTNEKLFQKQIFKNIQTSPNRKLAYVFIHPEDSLWDKLGMDNVTTSEIMKDFRAKIIEHRFDDKFLSKEKQNELQDVTSVITFYRKSKSEAPEYCMSIHSSDNSALKLIEKAKQINPDIIAGGHEDRAGGRIYSISEEKVNAFVQSMILASDIL